MANTYFKIEAKDSEKYEKASHILSLTAFTSKQHSIQLSLKGANGHSCIMISDNDASRIAYALLERVEGKISSTGDEVSEYSDDLD